MSRYLQTLVQRAAGLGAWAPVQTSTVGLQRQPTIIEPHIGSAGMAPRVLGIKSMPVTASEVAQFLALGSINEALPRASSGSELAVRTPSGTRAGEPRDKLLSDDSAPVSATTILEPKAQQGLAIRDEALPHASAGDEIAARASTRTRTAVPKAEAREEPNKAVNAQSIPQPDALVSHPHQRRVHSDGPVKNRPYIRHGQTTATTEHETSSIAPRHGRVPLTEPPKRVASSSGATAKISPAEPNAASPPTSKAGREKTLRLNDELTARSTKDQNQQSFAHPMTSRLKNQALVRGVVQAHPAPMPSVVLPLLTPRPRGKQEDTPVVQVRIGRVDVRSAPSPQASPPVVQKTRSRSGFDDYFALRSYNRLL